MQHDLNSFYLKTLLWIPPPHYINVVRLVLYFLMGLPAVSEIYHYVWDPECKQFGMHAWMIMLNIMTEVLIVRKFSEGEFPNPMPTKIKVFWVIFGIVMTIFVLWQFVIYPYITRPKKSTEKNRRRSLRLKKDE